MHDGQIVTQASGRRGMVLAADADGHYAHVRWDDGEVTIETSDDLDHGRTAALHEVASSLDDSLTLTATEGLQAHAARRVYDEEGPAGVLACLADSGHLSGFVDIAEQALALVSGQLRRDPQLRAATAALDEDEAETVLRLASAVLIRDAFGGDA